MRPDTLFVIGLGPAGGSVAWGAVQGGVGRVVGYDRVRGDAVQALRAGAVHAVTDRLEDGMRDAEMVVVTASGTDLLGRIASRLRPRALVTTLAQVAAPAAAAAGAAGVADRWAASHPLRIPVGDGFEGATADIFRGAVVNVTTTGPAGDDAAREVMHFWESVYGAEAVRMTVEEHDRRLAWMEQLPALLAALHADALQRGELGAATVGGAAARLSGLVPAGSTAGDFTANAAALTEALAGIGRSVDELRQLLATGDAGRLATFLARGRR
ncbi:MAG TPA: prephenate dehydrogenase/arogenate dehydrogenase family protein [Gemmatimonadales bacterium]|nr:prephenate dehydrogenase/arogenate dehydrogenase family protein [Gemmatimonadales bacterium]